ncbi:unnamed protein product [Mytilus edulis]|uniref:B box-type domain-containing protein n=1 Tax=Mytilus edulis TaxID=6550 RepID=A0A8S3RXQ6_MYTED|nr:unnamed protein product [Mytilus edulis]
MAMAQTSTQICHMCAESSGVLYCYECQHALCTICRELHDMIPATSEHTITTTSTIDLAVVGQKSQCSQHDKEFLFFCVNCNEFICSKCVISTHKNHSFSGITETVSEERDKAKLQITDLRAKIEPLPKIMDKMRCHIDHLQVASKKCHDTINYVRNDLDAYIGTRTKIRITEIDDNETLEQQRYQSFMNDSKHILKKYTQVISELENLLSEKHDITFHSCYGVTNIEIQNLVDVPTEPSLTQVPFVENKMLYREIIAHMESKVEDSLCQSCTNHQDKIDELLKEKEKLEIRFERSSTQMTRKDEEIRSLTLEIDGLKNKLKDVDAKQVQHVEETCDETDNQESTSSDDEADSQESASSE